MSGIADEPRAGSTRPLGLQVSLGGLIVLVLAAGVAAGVARSAREVWGSRTFVNSFAPGGPISSTMPVPVERTAGLVLEIAAVFLMVILARTVIPLCRGMRSADLESRRISWWRIAWRMGAAGFLLWFISEQSRVLRIDIAWEFAQSSLHSGWGGRYRVREKLFPVCGLFAIVGLTVGMGASFLFPVGRREGTRPYWAFVILAGIAAVIIVALPYWASLIPYLVLVALEAVTIAMSHAATPGPGLSARLLSAGINASVAGGLCLALAIVLARDFDHLRRARPWPATRFDRALRLASLLGAAVAGLYIAVVTIPAIHHCFAAGFLDVLDRDDAGMIVCCFGLFGAGMAARALAGPPVVEQSLGMRRVSVLARLAIIGILLFSILNSLPDSTLIAPYAPRSFTSAVMLIKEGLATFWNRLPDTFTATALGLLAIENLMWISLMLTVACFAIELLVRGTPNSSSPFDRLAESPERARRFAWLVFAFVVLCLAALPTLIVGGQALLHVRMHANDPTMMGWPR